MGALASLILFGVGLSCSLLIFKRKLPLFGPPKSYFDDLFITVKTTQTNHESRVDVIVETWFNLAPESIWFFTDADDKTRNEATKGHMVNTHCGLGHAKADLSCKMGKELEAFITANKRFEVNNNKQLK